jgi:hypothetical protein
MSNSASGRLKSAALDLEAVMDQVMAVWRDGKAEEFQAQHILPLLRAVEVGGMAMDEIASIVGNMKRECGPPRDDIL